MPTARVYCEESQEITKALREMGIEAFSVDLYPCSGGHPEWHIQGDMRDVMHEYTDLAIFHPVCRRLANSGVQWLHKRPENWQLMREAAAFFNLRHEINSPLVATENPIPHKYARELIGNYDCIFQPWHHGEQKMKATCLWLKGLPPLEHSNIVGPPPKDKQLRKAWQDVWLCPPGPEREKLRSKTYPGIAKAIANQYGSLIL